MGSLVYTLTLDSKHISYHLFLHEALFSWAYLFFTALQHQAMGFFLLLTQSLYSWNYKPDLHLEYGTFIFVTPIYSILTFMF